MPLAHPSERCLPRVLVVDGQDADRGLVRGVLSGMALAIDEAEDGVSAFSLLLGRPFDLVITGLGMHPLSGAELVMALQLFPAERRPKVIVTPSQSELDADATRLVLARADRVVPKPLSTSDLVAAVTTLLHGDGASIQRAAGSFSA